jgi:hypothetical protein
MFLFFFYLLLLCVHQQRVDACVQLFPHRSTFAGPAAAAPRCKPVAATPCNQANTDIYGLLATRLAAHSLRSWESRSAC